LGRLWYEQTKVVSGPDAKKQQEAIWSRVEELEKVFWECSSPDPIAEQVEAAVGQIEVTCQRVMQSSPGREGGVAVRALKACLWVTGLLSLLCVAGMFLPLSTVEALAKAFADQPLPDAPIFAYGLRVSCVTYVAIGVFYIMLALDPMKYGAMVPFSGAAAVFVGVCCGAFGLLTEMPLAWFMGDFLGCTVLGVLILLFWRRAVSQARTAENAEA